MKTNLFTLLLIITPLVVTGISYGDIIYESATLGQTGQIPTVALSAGATSGSVYYAGSRFHIDDYVNVTAIGGHFCGDEDSDGDLFGAIVQLNGPAAFPEEFPFDFDTPGLLASTLFVPEEPSSDYRTPLSVLVEPGDYAVIFGSDALGASDGHMGIPFLGQSWLPGGNAIHAGSSFDWQNVSPSNTPCRFVVEGTIVPEPATFLILSIGAVLLRKRH
jgi:hypothetical protein